jgi:2-methylfumaryl-CoA isomerase
MQFGRVGDVPQRPVRPLPRVAPETAQAAGTYELRPPLSLGHRDPFAICVSALGGPTDANVDEELSHSSILTCNQSFDYTTIKSVDWLPAPTSGILADLRIVELSAFVAGPLASATLASLGAEVIRLEQRGGGIDSKRWPLLNGRSLYRDGLDRGKRSVALDLGTKGGQEIAAALITAPGAEAGIFVTNLKGPEWMAYETLTQQRPDLVMVTIGGTHDDRPAVDYTINAGLGFPLVTGPANLAGPVNQVLPAWDVATGLLAAVGVLVAERRRRLTGSGEHVRLALADAAITIAEQLGFLAEAREVDAPRRRIGNDLYGAYGRDFQTADGRYVMVVALTPRQWRRLVAATDLAVAVATLERLHSIDLDNEGARFEHRDLITDLLAPWVSSRSFDDVAVAFDSAGVLWSPYRTFQEAVRDVSRVAHPPVSPLTFSTSGEHVAASAPRAIGADTDDVLRRVLGLTNRDLLGLRSDAVID